MGRLDEGRLAISAARAVKSRPKRVRDWTDSSDADLSQELNG